LCPSSVALSGPYATRAGRETSERSALLTSLTTWKRIIMTVVSAWGDRALSMSVGVHVLPLLVEKYNLFIFEVVKAHVAGSPRHPQTPHYTGDGVFMVAGKIVSRKSLFRPGML
jgi:hypothetical protein